MSIANRSTSPDLCLTAKLFRLKQFMNRYEIAEALRHFLAFNLQEAIMHPDIGHAGRAKCAATLCNFILVMRENEIDSAAVNIKSLTEIAMAHR